MKAVLEHPLHVIKYLNVPQWQIAQSPARVLITAMPPGPAEGYFRELAKLPPEAGEAEWAALGKKWGDIVVGPPLEAD